MTAAATLRAAALAGATEADATEADATEADATETGAVAARGPFVGQTLLVLGGADGALTTIHAAHRLGLRTTCVDLRSDSPGSRVADDFLHVSTDDVDGIVAAIANRTDVCGVVSPASDVNVPHQYAVATQLGLPCELSPAVVRASTDKAYFRRVCDGLGLPGPRHVAGTAAEVRAAAGLRWPVMVKPTDLGGGRGVVRCERPGELAAAVQAAAAWSPTGQVIVEEFVAGRDLGMEAVVVDGAVRLLGLSDRVLGPSPRFVTLGHDMGPGPEPVARTVGPMLEQVCAALGYRRGFVNADLIWTETGEVVMIEMGARLGGNGVSELLGVVHGIDSTELYVQLAIGADVEVPAGEPFRYAASRVLHARESGTLVALRGVDEARALPGVVGLVVAAVPGDQVEPYVHCRAKVGFVVVVGSDRDQRASVLADVDSMIRVDVEPEQTHELDDQTPIEVAS